MKMLKIILFGAGNVLKETLRYLDGSKAKVIAICDNDQSKYEASTYCIINYSHLLHKPSLTSRGNYFLP